MVPCKRREDIKKNLKEGDMVMMKYSGNVQDEYRRARVLAVYTDKKELVRSAYCSQDSFLCLSFNKLPQVQCSRCDPGGDNVTWPRITLQKTQAFLL